MTTWLAIFSFEVRYYWSRLSTHVYFGIFATLGILQMASMGGLFPGVPGRGFDSPNTHLDSPYALGLLFLVFSLFGTMVVAAVAGHSAQRDFGEHMHPLVFTTPIRRSVLLSARFVVAWLVGMYAALGTAFGICFVLLVLPVDPNFVGSFTPLSVVVPYALYIGPNVLLTTALFFVIAGTTRRMFPNYIGGIGLLCGYLLASNLTDIEDRTLASMLDPFGLETLEQLARYWTPSDKNTLQLWPDAVVWANRALWGGLGLVIAVVGSLGIRFSEDGWDPLARFRRATVDDEVAPVTAVAVPVVPRHFGRATWLAQYRVLTVQGLREVVGNRYFFAIVGGGVLFLLLQATNVGQVFGTSTWPVTYEVLDAYNGAFGLFLVIVLTFYAGDLVWRERDLQVAEVMDATPMPTGVALAAKVTALMVVLMALQGIVLVAGVLTQLYQGYTHLELGLYLQDLYGLHLLDWLGVVLLAIGVHTVVNHKYLGHFVMILYWVGVDLRGAAGFEHNLPWFGSDPGLTYSDLNGWGSGLFGYLVFKVHWFTWGLALLVLSYLLTVRGVEASVAVRLRELRRRATVGPVAALGTLVAVALGLSAFIFYNTNVLHDYQVTEAGKDDRADYEQRYKAKWDGAKQPRVGAVDLAVDLHPATGGAEARGTLAYTNRHDTPIDTLFVETPVGDEYTWRALDPGVPFTDEEVDEDHGVHLFDLATPLAPGASATLSFEVARTPRGFANDGFETTVVDNGTFLNSGAVLPVLGYNRENELSERYDRASRGLPERRRMPDLDDPVAVVDTYISSDADWIDFRATVSTDPDQIAIAPGYLQREWTDGGRRFFEYQMDSKILNFTSILSARYEVTRGAWRDLPIEVYHHPDHDFNVERMIESVQHSLDYYTEHFGPYQHRQVRILEFPRYASFAQSFPNTIPYSEGIGFIARVEDPDEDIDYVYYVTAHEIAHQWWGHQLVGGNVQGATVLSETLSQYSALMVMEETYGADQIRRFLEYELDSYLRGRSGEREKELPLLRVENQGYIHYRKGSLVMYRLKDELGEDVVNGVLKRLLERYRFGGPPYPTSRDLIAELRAVTPPELEYLIEDLFETITLYDVRTEAATWTLRPDGRYDVHLDIRAAKLRADEKGLETPTPMRDRVDVGVFAGTKEDPEILYFEKHELGDDTDTLTIVVDREPTRAGLDPWHKLIDRDGDDNVVACSQAP